jgi:hypothetical protein
LPKNFRDDPFADPPPITENDIQDGMFSLLNRGIIPRDVDLSPAFERGNAPFAFLKASIVAKQVKKPKHLSAIVTHPTRQKTLPAFMSNQQEVIGGPTTFITQLQISNVQEHLARLNG